MALTVSPESAMTTTWAANRAVKCLASSASQGTRTVTTPWIGHPTLGTLQWTIVLYCQMSRWRHSRSRVS